MNQTAQFRDGIFVDVSGNARAEASRAKVGSTLLAAMFGRSQATWSRKLNGREPLRDQEIQQIALACRIHPAVLFGGEAPAGWVPPEPPTPTGKLLQLDLNQQPFD